MGISVLEVPNVPSYWRERFVTAMKGESEARKINSHKRK